jgi:trk system potassium uptake protein
MAVNFSTINPFRNLKTENHQYAVIGLGRFGRAVCTTLHQLGHDVLGVDNNEKLVSQALAEQYTAHAVQLDSTEPMALKEAGLFEFDTVIVAIGNYIQESVVTTLNLKEGGVAKASNDVHGKLLQKIGADRVVFPEHEMGCNLAQSLTRPNILERLSLDVDHSVVEITVPGEFDGQTIAQLNLRSRFGLNLLALGEDKNRFQINPNPDQRLRKGQVMVVIGDNAAIEKLPR